MPGNASKYDCQTCGACCASPWTGDGYVRLYDIDLERLRGTPITVISQEQIGADPLEVVLQLGTIRDKHDLRVCMALSGVVGQACSCSIYQQRPEACRKFESGDVLCRQARNKAGLPV